MGFKTILKREKRYICIISALGVLSGMYLVTSLLYFRASFFLNLLISVALAAALVFIVRRHRAKAAVSAECTA